MVEGGYSWNIRSKAGHERTDHDVDLSFPFLRTEKFTEAKHFYAWKGYDFDVLNGLDDEDLIRQGSRRSKSVYLTETGKEYAGRYSKSMVLTIGSEGRWHEESV